ncbi:MAG: formate--tetrahydrofolate ligase [Rhodospirillales bacterium]|jgi:formate--tetrahydrofolate ligase|nr:formate--tetrahydrofolate ligase [Rhodospirillales bacterium]
MANVGKGNAVNQGSDIEIARTAKMLPIDEIGEKIGVPAKSLYRYGAYKAKLSTEFVEGLKGRPEGKLILVTAMTPTPAGEGKTTTSVGLADALERIGKKTIVCLREPSLGPCFGVKGGAAGGGYAQVVPMEDINLHFTGDFHAISAANNLLAALIDNHVYWTNELNIDPRRVAWRRVMDMNDRALRAIVCSLGGVPNGFPREDGFDITPASEVMAILCLAEDLEDLNRRLGNIIVGHSRDREPVRAREIKADGPMSVLLRDAMMPNLVQTLENTPAILHGGPFANIAHGCNSVVATRTALRLADYVVTEAGFGADLGAEKFFDIKCRKAGLKPDAAVLVATIRALKMHGGVEREDLEKENIDALEKGVENLSRHVENLRNYGVPQVVVINRFTSDTDAEINFVRQQCAELDVSVSVANHWAEGGAGAEDLAREVVDVIEDCPTEFRPLYPDNMPLWDKVRTVAQMIYGARGIIADKKVRDQFKEFQDGGFGDFPVCIAKTQYSFSTDPNLKGAPSNHVVPVREIRLAGGAEFLVVLCGEIMTMPGLPRVPAANHMFVDKDARIEGLF